ncbi:MAG: type II toxin-antitoxin system Phd/YefM family antitoxin [Gemmatimonadaceae bacterium]
MRAKRHPASKARENFSAILNEVSVRGDRVVLDRHGKPIAAMIPIADLELLEALEDRYGIELAPQAPDGSDARIPWELVKASLDL